MKNMKLTNLSLSVLIALGLVACGGSDNKDNTPLDKDQHGETGGNGGNGGKPEVTPEHTGNIPQRYAPGLNVPDDLKGQVAARKRFVVRRGFADPALGYDDEKDTTKYNEKVGTNPENIKKKSLYNYVEENDLIVVSGDGTKATGGFDPASKGAISIGLPKDPTTKFGDTTDHVINAWAKGADGKYYRLVPDEKDFTKYNVDTKFVPVDPTGKTDGKLDSVKQKDVVFIANADLTLPVIELEKAGMYILGQPDKQKEVVLDNVSAFGNTYNVEKLSQNIDLSQLPKDKTKIQVEDIKAEYRVINTKGTANSDDDKIIRREATLGKFKVYNLPHSIAFVTTNADMSGEKNVFNLDGNGDSKFQLNGFQTVSLPKDGRATYTGKSFSATVEGDIELFADFFENEAGISGRVYNRKEKKGDKVEDKIDLALERITFSDPQKHATYAEGAGKVKGDSDYANSWTVQLYGADAQEAGGFLYKSTPNDPKDLSKGYKSHEIVEVYTSQREELYPKSNDNTTK